MASTGSKTKNVNACRTVYIYISNFGVGKIKISRQVFTRPLKRKPPLRSSSNNLSNGGSNAVITLHKAKQSYIYSPLGQIFCTSYGENQKKIEYLLNSSDYTRTSCNKSANKLLHVCTQAVNKLCSHCLFPVCCNKFETSC